MKAFVVHGYDDGDARRFLELLRCPGGDRAAQLEELNSLSRKLLIDENLLLHLAHSYASADAGSVFLNQVLHARSEAVRSAAADDRAAGVRRAIDGIRQREGDLPNTALAARLNAMRVPAPRGGAWSAAQVWRVLKRTEAEGRPRGKGASRREAAAFETGHAAGAAERAGARSGSKV